MCYATVREQRTGSKQSVACVDGDRNRTDRTQPHRDACDWRAQGSRVWHVPRSPTWRSSSDGAPCVLPNGLKCGPATDGATRHGTLHYPPEIFRRHVTRRPTVLQTSPTSQGRQPCHLAAPASTYQHWCSPRTGHPTRGRGSRGCPVTRHASATPPHRVEAQAFPKARPSRAQAHTPLHTPPSSSSTTMYSRGGAHSPAPSRGSRP